MNSEFLYTLANLTYFGLIIVDLMFIFIYKLWAVRIQEVLMVIKFILLGFLILHTFFWCEENGSWRVIKSLAIVFITLGEFGNLRNLKKKVKRVRES